MLVTPFLTAVFALFLVYLSLDVVRYRFGNKISLGDGDNIKLRVAIRVQANFIEYVPLALLLLWFIETVLFDSGLTLILGSVLLIGRIMHVIGMRHPKKYIALRQVGIVATLSVLLVAAARVLWFYLPF